jgi:hypothetical protein
MPSTNTLITSSIILKEGLMQLDNELVMAKLVHRDYEDEFLDKNGATRTIKKPNKYTVRDGATASPQDTTMGSTTITIDQFKGVDLQFSTKDLTLSVDRFSEEIMRPAMRVLANNIDQALMALYAKVPNYVGTPGTTMAGFAAVGRGAQRLAEQAVPEDYQGVVSQSDRFGLLTGMQTLYVQDVAKTALTKAKLPNIAGVDLYGSNNVPAFTTGARGGAPLVNGASQNVTYLASKDSGTQTLNFDGCTNSVTGWGKAGDVFTIAGVYDVNPVTGDALDYLKQFVLTADVNSNGSGQIAATISPAIIVSGAFKTCSAAPADNAAMTFVGSAATAYRQNLFFNKNAFALATRPLILPDGVVGAGRETFNGISARLIPYYDGTNDLSNWRLDILYGVKAIYPELCTRVAG